MAVGFRGMSSLTSSLIPSPRLHELHVGCTGLKLVEECMRNLSQPWGDEGGEDLMLESPLVQRNTFLSSLATKKYGIASTV